ncbi:hypothetical protein WOLCODRAFT_164785 [Wolfiporia cocos MD-104 SS10]|uniref:Uncharacterized protein n=1 Tax=Wolfiporia cocos (strain MD-104) TaxID=742152 RepID=A0A2H3K169_WOLCO|nr:hypothetical protein WOLCODRAFT_164785 [Wolfiporia cocos MD-104 SS10]
MPSRLLDRSHNSGSQRDSALERRGTEPVTPGKRRKTLGLNSQFDRMMDTINNIHTSSGSSARSRPRRNRAASSSSVSLGSYDVPKTPVYIYNGLDEGRLGSDFSVLKMKPSGGLHKEYVDEENIFGTKPSKKARTAPIPEWLGNTLSMLDPRHPLRVLLPSPLPRSPMEMDSSSALRILNMPQPANTEKLDEDEPIFAFGPPQDTTSEKSAAQTLALASQLDDQHSPTGVELQTSPAQSAGSLYAPRDLQRNAYSELDYANKQLLLNLAKAPLDNLPYSTPGLASEMFDKTPALPIHSAAHSLITVPDSAPVHDLFEMKLLASAQSAQLETPPHDGGAIPFATPGPLARLKAQSPHAPLPHLSLRFSSPPDEASLESPRPANVSLLELPSSSGNGRATPPQRTQAQDALRTSSPLSLSESPALSSPLLHIRARAGLIAKGPESIMDNSVAPADSTGQSDHSQAVPFSTPGPAHPQLPRAAAFNFYFDAPVEDPRTYDFIGENEYALALDYERRDDAYDLDTIDFRWQRFERNIPGHQQSGCMSSDGSKLKYEEPAPYAKNDQVDEGVPRTPVLSNDVPARSSPSLDLSELDDHSNEELDDSGGTWILPRPLICSTLTNQSVDPALSGIGGRSADSSPEHGVPFAPAPGIYLSPLRGDDEEQEASPTRRNSMEDQEDMDHEELPISEKDTTSHSPRGSQNGEQTIAQAKEDATAPIRATPRERVQEQPKSTDQDNHGDAPGAKPRHKDKWDRESICHTAWTSHDRGDCYAREVSQENFEGEPEAGEEEAEDGTEDIEEMSEAKLSQESHDTIESWTAVENRR